MSTTGVELDPDVVAARSERMVHQPGKSDEYERCGRRDYQAHSNITATAERVMTDPVAVPNGAVFFTTFAPAPDICSFGGNTFLWRLKYDTGSFIPMSGTALLQLSTGEIKELDMKTAFADKIAVIDSIRRSVKGRPVGRPDSREKDRRDDRCAACRPGSFTGYFADAYRQDNTYTEEMTNRGVTLVELIVVIAVIGILAIALGFSYVGWQGAYKVEKTTKDLYTDLMDARSRAMTQSREYFVDFPTATTYRISMDDSDGAAKVNDG